MKKTKLAILLLIIISAGIFALKGSLNAANPDDMITVKGTFTDITRPNITFKTEDGAEYIIHLGPVWYWEENNYSLTLNLYAEIYGKLETGTKDIYAHKITINGTEIKLVDDKGDPLWWNDGKGKNRGNGWGMKYNRGMGARGCCCMRWK